MGHFFAVLVSFLFISQIANANPGVEVDVQLSPAGSFKAKGSVKGLVKQRGNVVISNQVIVDMNSLKTGIALRDKHLKQRLMTDKFPTAKLVKAKGTDGKAKAIISLMGKQHQINTTYTTKGKFLTSSFTMNLASLGIKDVKYMGVGVKDEVVVKVTVPVEQVPMPKAPAAAALGK